MNILTLKNVSYKYNNSNKNIISNVNIAFHTGRLYSIVGKSGVGKSTLISILSGLDICTTGSIVYKDKDLKEIDRDKYRAEDIGVVFQGYNLLFNISAVDNIVISMEISNDKRKNKKEIAYSLLERVGLNREKSDRKILKLSGGEQQRVAIARALSHNPDIIIADEPTANLDDDIEKSIISILDTLVHKENKCVIIATHSNKIARYSDEVWAITNGNLLFIK